MKCCPCAKKRCPCAKKCCPCAKKCCTRAAVAPASLCARGGTEKPRDPKTCRQCGAVCVKLHGEGHVPGLTVAEGAAHTPWPGTLCAAGHRGPRGGGGMEELGTWASRTRKRSAAGYANYWAPLTRKRHIPPHPAQPQHTNHWAPRPRKRHQQEHRPQRPSDIV